MLVAFRRSLINNRPSFARTRHSLSPNPRSLLSGIKNFLLEPANYPRVHGYINKILDRHLPAIPNAAVFYEQIIVKLVRQRFYKEATDIYQRMLGEEVVPTLETRAQMLALAFSISGSEVEINKAVDTFLIDNELPDGHISRVLEHVLHFGASVDRITRILEGLVARRDGYVPTQALVSRLAGAQVRDGNVEAAFATILQHGDTELTSPYAAMINALRDTKLSDVHSLNLILGLMYEKNIHPDLAVINSLLSWELHRHAIQKLWKIYHIMKLESEKGTITPNATTFGILFTSFLQDGASDLDISPRSVYHDMAFFHERVPMKMNTHLLNIALRIFVESHDYAGALVVLRSFRFWKIRVSARTYSIILRHVTHRIITAIEDKTQTKYRWSCRFLGISAGELRELKADAGLVGTILAFSRASTFKITRGIMQEHPQGVNVHVTPTLEQIKKDRIPHAFSDLPLQRILLRAMLAGAPSGGHQTPWSYISRRVRKAKEEMLFRPNLVRSGSPLLA